MCEFEQVAEAARSLAELVDLELLLPKILDELALLVPSDLSVLYYRASPGDIPKPVEARGLSSNWSPWLSSTVFATLPDALLYPPHPSVAICVSPELRLPARPGARSPLAVRAAFWVPVVFRGRLLAAIGLGRSGAAGFGKNSRRLVECLASRSAVAIEMANLHRQLDLERHSRRQFLGTLAGPDEVFGLSAQATSVLQDIVQRVAESFESSRSAISLLDHQQGNLLVAAAYGVGALQVKDRIPMDGSASGWIVRHGKPLLIPSVPDSPFPALRTWYQRGVGESFVGVPLVINGKAIGAMNAFSRRGRRFEESDIEPLKGLAAQAAIAIERIGLHELVVREKAKLEAVVESFQEGLALVDQAGTIVFMNERFAGLLEVALKLKDRRTIESVWGELVSRNCLPDMGEKLRMLQHGASGSTALTMPAPRRDLEVRSLSVDAPDGEVLGRLYLVRDITQEGELERLKTSMLSTVSHELRTPLAAIKGFASSLLRKDVDWDEASRTDFLCQIDREADRLEAMVRNLLEMSRLDSGTIRLDLEWCDVNDLISDVTSRFEPIAAGHQVILALHEPMNLAYVDRRYIERVIWNLLENAAKYSPRGSQIALEAFKEGGEAIISVRDQGIGIRPEDQKRIFERFYRGAGVRASGIGLGLAICKGIVEAHGGDISLYSEPGKGSTFTVRLPAQSLPRRQGTGSR